MPVILIAFSLLAALLVSCGGSHDAHITAELDRADSLLLTADTAAHSAALQQMLALDTARALQTDEALRARHALLLVQARYKCYVTDPADSALIDQSLRYYADHHGSTADHERYTRALIYSGAVAKVRLEQLQTEKGQLASDNERLEIEKEEREHALAQASLMANKNKGDVNTPELLACHYALLRELSEKLQCDDRNVSFLTAIFTSRKRYNLTIGKLSKEFWANLEYDADGFYFFVFAATLVDYHNAFCAGFVAFAS